MDAALRIIDARAAGGGVICCLDADTLVEENYLSAFRTYFTRTGDPAAVSAYAHQKPDDPKLQAAICCYEIFLRSYVIGLSYAGSPYAFHSIGSTMACTADGYTDVRGMNRRTAAEDFHFLNKLAKIGKIGTITETTVFPSSRPSGRVPFGTGRSMLRFLTGGTDEYRLYDPRIFVILKEWLAAMEADPDRDPETILDGARPYSCASRGVSPAESICSGLDRHQEELPRCRTSPAAIPCLVRRIEDLETGSSSQPFRLSIGSHVRRPEGTDRSPGSAAFTRPISRRHSGTRRSIPDFGGFTVRLSPFLNKCLIPS